MPGAGCRGVVFALAFSMGASAGPWVKDQGDYYAKGSMQRFTSTRYVDASNQVVELEGAWFEGDLFSLYTEVGLGHGLGIVAMIPYAASRNVYLDPRVIYGYRGLGDVELGLQYGRRFGSVPVSLTVQAKLPFYDNHDPRITPGQQGVFPILGDGQIDVTTWLAVGGGFSLGPWGAWALGEGGFRVRTGVYPFDSAPPDMGFAEGVTWRTQVGVLPRFGSWEAGWVALEASGVVNVATDERTRQWTQLAGSVAGRLWEAPAERRLAVGALHLELGLSALVLTRNSAPGWAWNVGLSAQR